jgi:hypothetical protein
VSDLRENPGIAAQEVLIQIDTLKLNIRKAELLIMQRQDEIVRNEENIEASMSEVKRLEKQYAQMSKGAVSDE